MTCPVCCEAYTRVARAELACPGCAYGACVRCVQAYLLSSSSDPCCMNCRCYWRRAFLDERLTSTWRNGPLKKHRELVLLDRERSLLPAAQPAVTAEAMARQLLQRRRDLVHEIRACRDRLRDLTCELHRADSARHEYQHQVARGLPPDAEPDPQKRERRAFVAACPDEACRGFLSTQYRCGTCLRSYCAACREPKTEAHACDPAVVASLQLIAREGRACPGCGITIVRVSGCDQMYCTSCFTAFSYSSGQRIQGVIHNPHYFERMRHLQEGGGADACDADAWPPVWSLPHKTQASYVCISLYRAARHVEQTVLPTLPTAARPEDTLALRVRYCLGDYDEAHFMTLLQRHEKRREFMLELRATLELFIILVLEHFAAQRRGAAWRSVVEALFEPLEETVNAPLRALAKRYKAQVPQILLPREGLRRVEELYQSVGL